MGQHREMVGQIREIRQAATEVIAELKNPGKYHHNAIDPFMLTDIEI